MKKVTAFQKLMLEKEGINIELRPDGEHIDLRSLSVDQKDVIQQIIINERASGKTTRLVDRWIQELFTNGKTFIYEGRGEKTWFQQRSYAWRLFTKRMASEHENIVFEQNVLNKDGINCFEITLKGIK